MSALFDFQVKVRNGWRTLAANLTADDVKRYKVELANAATAERMAGIPVTPYRFIPAN